MRKKVFVVLLLGLVLLISSSAYAFIYTQQTQTITQTIKHIVDITPPRYSSLSASPLKAGSSCTFSATWTDNKGLESTGGYIFSTNNTGTWQNDTWASFISNLQTVTVAKTLNTTVGTIVGYRWFANDTSNNWNSTAIQTLTTTYYHVISMTTVAGTVANGTISNLNDGDAGIMTINEASGTSAIDLRFNFTNVPTTPTQIQIFILQMYNGKSSHHISVSAWNFSSSAWVQYGIINHATTYTWENVTITTDPEDFVQNNNVTIRLLHIQNGRSSDKLYLDTFVLSADPADAGPVYNNIGFSSNEAGVSNTFSAHITCSIFASDLEYWIFSTNNTGSWVNETATTLNSIVGNVIEYKYYANCTGGSWTASELHQITTVDTTSTSFGSITGNTTVAGSGVTYSCTISDLVGVSGYIASWNNTGSWVNGTWASGSAGSLTGTHNATVGNVVSVVFYANDTSNNWGQSSQYNFTLTP
jgi:hypothetical protein